MGDGGGRLGGTAHDLDRIPTQTREFEGGTGQDMVGGDEETPRPRRRPVGALTRLAIPEFSGQLDREATPGDVLTRSGEFFPSAVEGMVMVVERHIDQQPPPGTPSP